MAPFCPLNRLLWFERFYDLQNKFSYRFNPIGTETLRNLEALAH